MFVQPAILSEAELFRSCEVVFGPDIDVSREFLHYIQLPGIKSAYRKRAMETHPDLAGLEDKALIEERHRDFLALQDAYKSLLDFLDAREKGHFFLPPPSTKRPSPPPPHPFHARPQPQRPFHANPQHGRNFQHTSRNAGFQHGATERSAFWDTESLYRGPLPNRHLLFGHFLYYSGLITWRTIIQALVWQRSARPRLGELGRRFGMLNEEDILHILRHRPSLEPFGQTAIQLGLLSRQQMEMLIFHQKRLQKKFGEFFLEKQLLRPDELEKILCHYRQHNARILSSRR